MYHTFLHISCILLIQLCKIDNSLNHTCWFVFLKVCNSTSVWKGCCVIHKFNGKHPILFMKRNYVHVHVQWLFIIQRKSQGHWPRSGIYIITMHIEYWSYFSGNIYNWWLVAIRYTFSHMDNKQSISPFYATQKKHVFLNLLRNTLMFFFKFLHLYDKVLIQRSLIWNKTLEYYLKIKYNYIFVKYRIWGRAMVLVHFSAIFFVILCMWLSNVVEGAGAGETGQI